MKYCNKIEKSCAERPESRSRAHGSNLLGWGKYIGFLNVKWLSKAPKTVRKCGNSIPKTAKAHGKTALQNGKDTRPNEPTILFKFNYLFIGRLLGQGDYMYFIEV